MEWMVYGMLFLMSVIYAIILQIWQKRYPHAFYDFAWLMGVVGDGCVLVGLYWLLPIEAWLTVCGAFVVAAPPIVARAVVNCVIRRQAEMDDLRQRGRK